MAPINLRDAMNAISEVIINRPSPLREFDQIYMKAGDMLLQTEHISYLFKGRNVIFIGDGDSIGLCLVHLFKQNILTDSPHHIHVLDFDERIVNSIRSFAKKFYVTELISAELYNVADSLPKKYWQNFSGFYSNPPFGSCNGGKSIEAFLGRAIEASGKDCVGSVAIADHKESPWAMDLLFSTQKFMARNGFYISELVPAFSSYHLDDNPSLTSCSISFNRHSFKREVYNSKKLSTAHLKNFYGSQNPLIIKYVKDLTISGKMVSKDHELIKY